MEFQNMATFTCLLSLFSLCWAVHAFEVRLIVVDDNNSPRTHRFKRLANGSLSEIKNNTSDRNSIFTNTLRPSGNKNTEDQIRPRAEHTTHRDHVRNERGKRDALKILKHYNRKSKMCESILQMAKARNHNRPIHKAVMASNYMILTCHFCGETSSSKYQGMRWYKINRPGGNSRDRFVLKEIIPDMHDDEEENRITMLLDHSLMITTPTHGDIGGYFCVPNYNGTGENAPFNITSISTVDKFLQESNHFRLVYHVDKLGGSKIPDREVSRFNPHRPDPLKIPLFQQNYYIMSQWGSWSECDTCDRIGNRIRYGKCIVKKLDSRKIVEPWYAEAALSSFPSGLPCRSTVFNEVPVRLSHPDEYELELCEVPCKVNKKSERKWFNIISSKKVTSKSGVDTNTNSNITRNAGARVTLTCPGASAGQVVFWLKETTYLNPILTRNATRGRITIDFFKKLIIRDSRISDSGIYSCWYKDENKGEINLIVNEPLVKEDDRNVHKYSMYLMYIYPVEVMLFITILIIRYIKRASRGTRSSYVSLTETNSESSHPFLDVSSQMIDSGTTPITTDNNFSQSNRSYSPSSSDSSFVFEDTDTSFFSESDSDSW